MFEPIELQPFVLYELKINGLALEVELDGTQRLVGMDEALTNGRGSYLIFERLVRLLFGLEQAVRSDHRNVYNQRIEQKAYVDPQNRGYQSPGEFQTSASATFPANNFGPQIRQLLRAGDYSAAFDICFETGYSKNDLYIYTNTGNSNRQKFDLSYPFRCVAVPTKDVLELLNKSDPRYISIEDILARAKDKLIL